ncbi:MAG: DUF3326 domain-containing protein [Candidatus Marinimicrobia bacterium]|nr:DUF3326 domain-containing protein [Candidatus Neomarinimicrobiota bacterium]
MRLYEKEFELPIVPGHKNLINHFSKVINEFINKNEIPVRFVVTETKGDYYHCELGLLSGRDHKITDSIFHFSKRSTENIDKFNTVLLVPTGIGAEIGGHSGDAGPVAKLLSETCDTLITHPNVVNASDINEMPDNGLYVEGSIISRLLMGTLGLQPVRSNRVLVVIDNHPHKIFAHAAINSVNGARAAYGFQCPRILQLDPPIRMSSEYSSSGRAVGKIDRLRALLNVMDEYRDEYDAVALSSVINVPKSYHTDYYKSEGSMINPWGGVEAILTHGISLIYNVPSAHSPMFESPEIANMDPGVVDPRMAAEVVSVTFLQSVLKGLHRSPRIITDPNNMLHPNIITAEDISCLVIPDGCVGLPTLAALEQGIKVIAVRENYNLMKNDLGALPWKPGQLYMVDNYWEAAGVLNAIKAGIAPESVRRPLALTAVDLKTVSEKIAVAAKEEKVYVTEEKILKTH